jgi:DNA-binding CsgD family transcriptional regulator
MEISEHKVLALMARIYDAVLEPGRWNDFLRALNEVIDAECAAMHLQSLRVRQSGRILAAVGVDPKFQREYDNYYASVNIWAIRGRHQLREGAVLTSQMVCPDEVLQRSEYYNDFLKRLDVHHSIAAVPAVQGDAMLIVASLARKGRGGFEPEAVRLLRHLTPHLNRAARIQTLVASSEFQCQALGQAVERLHFGLVLLDSARHVLFANRAARATSAARDGFELTDDGPVAWHSDETAMLRGLLSSAAQPALTAGPAEGVATLARPSGKRDLEVLVMPLTLPGAGVDQIPQAAVAMFIVDPSEGASTSEASLRHLYGLTPSEARVASALSRGESVADMAATFGLTLNSARWLVKQVLHKTDARSQAEAVAVITRGTATLARAG